MFQLSSFAQQYAATLHALHHLGHTKDMSHLARLFDPAAVLAGAGAAEQSQHCRRCRAPCCMSCLLHMR